MGDELLEGAKEVAKKLRDAGHEVYFAGGCVRDLLRSVAAKDYDLVTNARPEEVTRIFRRTVQVGAAFGVVRVLAKKGLEYEVATYRKDLGYSDGRHPDAVAYSTSKEEDVRRRDFTINALLMDPFTEEVIDLVGGRADLEKGVIRAVGDPEARFAEDRLRMLRAVRFAARFGFEIEAETLAAIERHAGAIGAVSIERIVGELEGVFSSANPGRGVELLVRTGLWAAVLPGAPVPRSIPYFEDLSDRERALVAFALVFDEPDPEDKLRALKLSRADIRTIVRVVQKTRALKAERPRLADLVRIALDPERTLFSAFIEAQFGGDERVEARSGSDERVEARSGNGERIDAKFGGDELILALERVRADLAAKPLPPLPLLTGDDLKALGIPAGPKYKELLQSVEDEVFERRITTKDEAIAWVKRCLAG